MDPTKEETRFAPLGFSSSCTKLVDPSPKKVGSMTMTLGHSPTPDHTQD